MPTIDFTNTRHLTRLAKQTKTFRPFLIETFFSKKEYAGSDTIDIELKPSKNRRAHFVGEEGEAVVVKGSSKFIKTLKVPSTYERKVFNQAEVKKMMPIESGYLSDSEQSDYVNEKIAEEVKTLNERVIVRRESMASDILFTGQLVVVQDDLKFDIDYGFVTNQNKITKSGTAKWDGTAADIIGDIMIAKSLGRKKGYKIDTLVLSPDLLKIFIKDVAVMKALDNNNYRVGALDLTKYADMDANYIGNILGVSIFEYANEYVDESNVSQQIVPVTKALFGASNNDNNVSFAPISRFVDGKMQVVSNGEMYMSTKTSEDGRSLEWKLEQRSLPVLTDINSIVVVTAV